MWKYSAYSPPLLFVGINVCVHSGAAIKLSFYLFILNLTTYYNGELYNLYAKPYYLTDKKLHNFKTGSHSNDACLQLLCWLTGCLIKWLKRLQRLLDIG